MRRAMASAMAAVALTVSMAGPAMAGPAMAGKPIKSTFIDEGSFEIQCDGFVLSETYTDRITVLEWQDGDGNPTRLQFHHSWTGTVTGPGGILTLSDPGHWTDFIDVGPDGDTVRQVGVIYKLVIKGQGLVAHDVGIITFHLDGSVTTQGPHDVFEAGVEQIYCPLFED